MRVVNYETGLDWTPSTRAQVRVSAYRADTRDEIVLVAAQRTLGYFQNLPRTRRTGVEGDARLLVAPWLTVRGSYAHLRATYESPARLASALDDAEDVAPGDRLPLSPAHRYGAGVDAFHRVHGALVTGGLSLSGVSSQHLRGDEANTQPPLPAWHTIAAHLSVERARVAVTMDVTNLLDRRYETFGIYGHNSRDVDGSALPEARVERFVTPGYPRAVTVGVVVRR